MARTSIAQYAPSMPIVIGLVTIALMIFALVDIITSQEWQVKHLPKMLWLILVILLPLIGSLIWLLVGKERAPLTEGWGSFGDPNRVKDAAPASTTEQELEALDREIAFYEKQEKLKRLEAELQQKRQKPPEQ